MIAIFISISILIFFILVYIIVYFSNKIEKSNFHNEIKIHNLQKDFEYHLHCRNCRKPFNLFQLKNEICPTCLEKIALETLEKEEKND